MDAFKAYVKVLEGLGEGWTFYRPYWNEEKADKTYYYTSEWDEWEFESPMFVRGKVLGFARLLREDWLDERSTHYRRCFPIYEEGLKIVFEPLYNELHYTSFIGVNRDDENGYGYTTISSHIRPEDLDED